MKFLDKKEKKMKNETAKNGNIAIETTNNLIAYCSHLKDVMEYGLFRRKQNVSALIQERKKNRT